MLRLAERLGFKVAFAPEDPRTLRVTLNLHPAGALETMRA
jgi:hypothetical protein